MLSSSGALPHAGSVATPGRHASPRGTAVRRPGHHSAALATGPQCRAPSPCCWRVFVRRAARGRQRRHRGCRRALMPRPARPAPSRRRRYPRTRCPLRGREGGPVAAEAVVQHRGRVPGVTDCPPSDLAASSDSRRLAALSTSSGASLPRIRAKRDLAAQHVHSRALKLVERGHLRGR